MIDRRDAIKAVMATGLGVGQVLSSPAAASPSARKPTAGHPSLSTLDMVHANPGEGQPQTHYLDPRFLGGRGYGGFVIERAIEGVPTFAAYDPGLIPEGSDEAQLAAKLKAEIGDQIAKAKQNGLTVYAWVQYVVLPKRLLAKHGHRFVDAMGRLDVQLPATQDVLRAFTNEILNTFPDLDGLVVRTGEIYLHDLPFHDSRVPKASREENETLIQSGTAIIQGEKSHLALLSVLRDTVCVKANKKLLYRTWDFGDNFHNNPRYYCNVTDAIAPHANLKFSIKHQRGDFHRLTPLNPTLGIGRHEQVIEVQCQMEAYGKGAYPYYVANGVIEGWEEYSWLMPKGAPRSVRDLTTNPLISGLWTWSRGGGWDGPYSADELWCDLNAYVLVTFAQDTSRTEASIFEQYGLEVLKLTFNDTQTLRAICLTSASAVLQGQLTNLGAEIDLWWARDDTLSEPQLSDFLSKGLVEESISEKQRAVALWRDIAAQMPHIRFSEPARQTFAEVSATYGLLKHSVIAAGWTACLLAADGQRNGSYDKERLREAINRYDTLWDDWRRLKAENPLCPSLPKQLARGDQPGLGAAMDRFRQTLKAR